jgi:DNA-binding SARP family transcriptional activator
MAVRGPTQRVPGEVRRRPATRRVSPRLRVSLLEGFAVNVDDSLVQLPHAAARVVVLVALQRAPLSRSRVAAILWPDFPAVRANACLRAALSRLMAACPGLVASSPAAVDLAPNVIVDARELDQLTLSAGGDQLPDDQLLEQLAVELLPGWEEEWVVLERDRLQQLCLCALERLADRQLDQRRFGPAIATIYAALRMDPLRESAARTLIEIHLAGGNRGSAVRCYLEFRKRSLAELGIEPSAEMQALVATLSNTRGPSA